MSICDVVVSVRCDYCRNEIRIQHPSLNVASLHSTESAAADYGWHQKDDGTDVCPSHTRAKP